MKIWRVDYYGKGAYRRKYVKAENSAKAIKKARLKNIVDLCIIPDDCKELEGKKII